MTTISERLRAKTYSKWSSDVQAVEDFEDEIATEAADTIDALVAALEGVLPMIKRHAEPEYIAALAALAKAKGKSE